jgi:class 3 adenylate cyclase
LKITHEVKAFALEQAGRRCECTGDACRHHLRGARCSRGLRGDDWKVFWRREDGGVNRANIEAWCLECFANNFEAPRETVALLALDLVGFARLIDEDRWQAVTLKTILRDTARRVAKKHGGGLVLDRADDDILLEFPTSLAAVEAARCVYPDFRDAALRLNLAAPEICGGIHQGEVTRWRNGLLVGAAVDITTKIRHLAGLGQVVLTGSAAEPLAGTVELEQAAADTLENSPVDEIWRLQL